jgi:hypothetical protein
MIGLSERSSPGAFDAMAEQLVKQQGIRTSWSVILPTDRAMIHLDMIFTMIDHEHCVVFPPNFVGRRAVPVLHYRAGKKGMREMPNLFAALRQLDMPLEPVFCGGARRTCRSASSGRAAATSSRSGRAWCSAIRATRRRTRSWSGRPATASSTAWTS